MLKNVLIILLSFFCITNIAYCNDLPKLFLFLGGDDVHLHKYALQNQCVRGAQIIYSWKRLEPKKGIYDFSKIENDIKFLSRIHKKLFIQVQDRSFEPTVFNVPDYIREDPAYHGGVAMQYDFPGEGKPITSGWVARVWDPAVRERFSLLIHKLAEKYDGKVYGINLPETAVDFDVNNLPQDFTFDNYFSAVIENMSMTRNSFHNSLVIQYVNFFPGEWNNDHGYMSQLFSFAHKHKIGLGGPDVVPYRTAHMKNSYPFFNEYKEKLLVGIAIQEPDYTYKNPETGDYYKLADFYHFSRDYLGAKILFWNVQEPFFSEQLVPEMSSENFNCAR